MLRLMFADQATPEDNRRAVEALRDWALDRMALGAQVVDSYRQENLDAWDARQPETASLDTDALLDEIQAILGAALARDARPTPSDGR